MRLDLGPDLVTVKAQAVTSIDAAAERSRVRFITPGSGQAMEYAATEAEAMEWAVQVSAGSTPVIADFPFIKAEIDAITAAVGSAPSAGDVVNQILIQAGAWNTVGSEIKRIRRQAKIEIDAATTVAQVKSIVAALVWPQ